MSANTAQNLWKIYIDTIEKCIILVIFAHTAKMDSRKILKELLIKKVKSALRYQKCSVLVVNKLEKLEKTQETDMSVDKKGKIKSSFEEKLEKTRSKILPING